MKMIEPIPLDYIEDPKNTVAVFKYFGGKSKMADKILNYFPKHITYVEPFCGSASLLFKKSQSKVEVINDLNSNIVNFFRVLQNNELADRLINRLVFTLYSREEKYLANELIKTSTDPVDKAWAWFVFQNQGFGGTRSVSWGKSLSTSNKGMADVCSSWRSKLKFLDKWHDRITKVQIDHVDALECIKYWDSKDTLFYIDPPYHEDTRFVSSSKKDKYEHEFNAFNHENLINLMRELSGQVVLSCYWHDSYSTLVEDGWKRVDFSSNCNIPGRTRQLKGDAVTNTSVDRVETILIKQHVTISQKVLW
jgi:DNA adenine methylase